MSDPLAARFAAWRSAHHTALIPYITAGYPTRASTADVLQRLVRAGADIIELGVPFSDPVADGPTIQRASQVALEQGVDLAWTLDQLRCFRREADTPVVIFSYLNPVLAYGWSRFISDAVAAGAQGVLLTDLPLGGDVALEAELESSALSLIRLVAPTTTAERARAIARNAQGFIYYIARMGVTGARAVLPDDLPARLDALRAVTNTPVCVGFGVSSAPQAAAVGRIADGVVVGSALIDALDRGGPAAAADLLAEMRRAL
ncbi:MAG TPA: tryptophan synthase subunit alpha [Longimicrobiales bacterium]